jgi:hypothetical protein
MTRLLSLPFITLAGPALAHPGHIATEAGHNHWVAVAATAMALGIVGGGVVRAIVRRRRRVQHG